MAQGLQESIDGGNCLEVADKDLGIGFAARHHEGWVIP